MNIKLSYLIYFLFFMLVLRFFSPEVIIDDLPHVHIILKDHQFNQNKIYLKAHTQYIVYIENQDDFTEEFESIDISIEKIIPGNSTKYFILHKLSPGIYKFQGEFHPKTAKGIFIVTENITQI